MQASWPIIYKTGLYTFSVTMAYDSIYTDDDLRDFCVFFRTHYRKTRTYLSGFTISMCGHYHILPRQANHLIKRCESLGFIKIEKSVELTILI